MKWGKPETEVGAEKQVPHRLWFTHDLLERALRDSGCIVCGALRISERKSIYSFLYEGMMSPLVRRDFLDGEGFCARHFTMAIQIEDECWPEGGIGIAILCQDLVRRIAGRIEHLHTTIPKGRKRQHQPDAIAPGSRCAFCAELRGKEQSLLEVLEGSAAEVKFSSALPDRLCAYHMELAIASWRSPEKRSWLADVANQQLAMFSNDLREFIRKHDYQRRSEASGRERDVVARVGAFLGYSESGRNTR